MKAFTLESIRILRPNTTFLRFGLRGLDEATAFHPGELCIVLGPASSGKSALLLSAAENCHSRRSLVWYYDHDKVLNNNVKHYWPFNAMKQVKIRPEGGLLIFDGGEMWYEEFEMKADALRNLRGIAHEKNCGVIVAIPSKADLNNLPIALDPDNALFRSADLVIGCRKVKENVNYKILKNRHGTNHLDWTHKVGPNLALNWMNC